MAALLIVDDDAEVLEALSAVVRHGDRKPGENRHYRTGPGIVPVTASLTLSGDFSGVLGTANSFVFGEVGLGAAAQAVNTRAFSATEHALLVAAQSTSRASAISHSDCRGGAASYGPSDQLRSPW